MRNSSARMAFDIFKQAATDTPWQTHRVIVCTFMVLLIAALLVFVTREIEVVVAGVSWRREIQVENFIPRRYSEWDENVPGDAYDLYCRAQVKYYNRVASGETCTQSCSGTGGTRRCTETCTTNYVSIPVYDDKCDYTANRWGYYRSLVSEATDRTPFWLELDFSPCEELHCQREGAHVEAYTVYFSENVVCNFPESSWAEFRAGDHYSLFIGTFIIIPRCDTIRRVS